MRKIEPWRTRELDRTAHRPVKFLDGGGVSYSYLASPDHVVFTIFRAIEARKKGDSYRGYHVGGAARIWANEEMTIISKHGANFKSGPGKSEVDEHAEDQILHLIPPDAWVSILAIAAYPQEDHGSGLNPPTLHPCFKCRAKLQESPLITKQSLLVTCRPDGRAIEWGTIDDYVNFHEGRESRLVTVQFDDIPPLFRPLPAPGKGGYHLYDGSELDQLNTSEWDTRVSLPLMEWVRTNLRGEAV